MKKLALFLVLLSPGIEAIWKVQPAIPAIIEKPINVTYNAQKLNAALKISNEAMIIRVLCDKTYTQRRQIAEKYKELYNESLADVVNSKMGGFFNTLIQKLLEDWDTYITRWLESILHFKYPDITLVAEVLTTRDAGEREALKYKYFQLFFDKLHYYPSRERPYEELIFTYIVERDRSDSVNMTEAIEDARRLNETKGETISRWQLFADILTSRSLEQIKLMQLHFWHTYGVAIETIITFEFGYLNERSFDERRQLSLQPIHVVLYDILKLSRNPQRFYAELFRTTMAGRGTQNYQLIYLLLSRAEIDLHSIRDKFDDLDKKESLYDWIIDDTSGYFREALLAILDGNNY